VAGWLNCALRTCRSTARQREACAGAGARALSNVAAVPEVHTLGHDPG
jgi:hypothetical protein